MKYTNITKVVPVWRNLLRDIHRLIESYLLQQIHTQTSYVEITLIIHKMGEKSAYVPSKK
jgi:hypothetical protein